MLDRLMQLFKTAAPVISDGAIRPRALGFSYSSDLVDSEWNGDKWHGSYGATYVDELDYETLRARSGNLFRRNIYARGILRRLVTNEINTGLELEAVPVGELIGKSDDELVTWDEDVERRFSAWASTEELVDAKKERTFSQLQALVRLEALISGDVLVVLDVHPIAGTPVIRLVLAEHVCTPLDYQPPKGRKVTYGVEVDSSGRHVGYWVRNTEELGGSAFVPATGKSGRRVAWLVYGTDRRNGDVRGEPILGLIVHSLKDVDRYRDAAVRKAVVNSLIAVFIEKTQDKVGSLPFTGGAIRKDEVAVADASGEPRNVKSAKIHPGLIVEELQVGEKIVPFSNVGTDIRFGEFEGSIINAVAWALEIPAEILTLSFSHNYSASQAALNEFRLYLERARFDFGQQFCSRVYREWFLSEVLARRIDAVDFLLARGDQRRYAEAAAWLACEWSGPIKPSTDPLKNIKAAEIAVKLGCQTPSQVARDVFGVSFRTNARKLKREFETLRELWEILGVVPQAIGPAAPAPAANPAPMGDTEDSDTTDDEEDSPKEEVTDEAAT